MSASGHGSFRYDDDDASVFSASLASTSSRDRDGDGRKSFGKSLRRMVSYKSHKRHHHHHPPPSSSSFSSARNTRNVVTAVVAEEEVEVIRVAGSTDEYDGGSTSRQSNGPVVAAEECVWDLDGFNTEGPARVRSLPDDGDGDDDGDDDDARDADADADGPPPPPLDEEFDAAYGPEATTAELYDKSVRPVVMAALEGRSNGLVLAYGRGGTGKTHTMTGRLSGGGPSTSTTAPSSSSSSTASSARGTDEGEPGVIPLAVLECFRHVKETAGQRQYELKLSFLEVNGDDFRDLLIPTEGEEDEEEPSPPPAAEGKGDGLPESRLTDLLAKGQARRTPGSHAVVRLDIESRPPTGGTAEGAAAAAANRWDPRLSVTSLAMVDLSGDPPKADGDAAKADDDKADTAKGRDESLAALDELVRKLSEAAAEKEAALDTVSDDVSFCSLMSLQSTMSESWGAAGVPAGGPSAIGGASFLQKSELMRALQPDLCGDDCRIVALCTVSPLRRDLEESRGTLRFGSRLRSTEALREPSQPPLPYSSSCPPDLGISRSRSQEDEAGGDDRGVAAGGAASARAGNGAEDDDLEIRALKRRLEEAEEVKWRLRRAEEEAAAHRDENAELRRQLAEAKAESARRAAAAAVRPADTSPDVKQEPSVEAGGTSKEAQETSEEPQAAPASKAEGEEVVDEDGKADSTDSSAPSPPSMCETNVSAPPPAAIFSAASSAPGSVDEEEEKKKLVDAIRYVDHVIKRVVTAASQASVAGGPGDVVVDAATGEKFIPPVISFGSNGKVGVDSKPMSPSPPSAGLPGATAEAQETPGEKLPNNGVTQETPRASGQAGKPIDASSPDGEDDDDGASWNPAGLTGDLLDNASVMSGSVMSFSSARMSVGGNTVRTKDSWAPAGATRELFDAASVASGSVVSFATRGTMGDAGTVATEGSWAPAGNTRELFDAASVASSFISARGAGATDCGGSVMTEGSWAPAGTTRELFDASSVASGSVMTDGSWRPAGSMKKLMANGSASLASGMNGNASVATENSWQAAGATLELMGAGSLRSVVDSLSTGGDLDDSLSGSWKPAGAVGALLDDDASLASTSTWDTFHSTLSRNLHANMAGHKEEDKDVTGAKDDNNSSNPTAVIWELYRIQGLLRSVLETKGGSVVD